EIVSCLRIRNGKEIFVVRARETLRSRRLNEKIYAELRASVLAGIPWTIPQVLPRGYADLIFLSKGLYYICEFIRDSADIERATSLWAELREEILALHSEHRPCTRPWAWWALEDREGRRRMREKPCTCPPAFAHRGLPSPNLSWFGRPRGCQCEYEDEAQ